MLESLPVVPEDPLLGVMAAYRRDPDPLKVDLGVGVFKTEDGQTPLPAAIAAAARSLAAEQITKVYVGQAGNERFNQSILQLTLGSDHNALVTGRARALQAPGGCGALRIGSELIRAADPNAVICVSDPTWANHLPLLGGVGLGIERYPYLDREHGSVNVQGMLERLDSLPTGSIVLLHGCCHNPTGADLTDEDWRSVAELLERRRLVPFIDLAYQGLADSLEADAYGARLLAARLPEVLVAVSCSKNFGLYRERTGAIIVVSEHPQRVDIAMSHLQRIARGLYSMPPDHGAELVARVWENQDLRAQWQLELARMGRYLRAQREALVVRLGALCPDIDYMFIVRQRGMFSLLPLTEAQILSLRASRHIYMTTDGRINVAGINRRNVDYVAESLATVLRRDLNFRGPQ
jgi:aspartate aminotransferase